MRLLSPGHTNTKLAKGDGLNDRYPNFILHLAPERLSGYNVCPNASAGCAAACLNSAGRGAFNSVQTARVNKTKRLFEDRTSFLDDLFKDLTSALRKAQKQGKKCVVRLNGTSDIAWESIKYTDGLSLIELFPEIQFYDYTKSAKRALRSVQDTTWPKNYHLTFSRAESNHIQAIELLRAGVSVAIVYRDATVVPTGAVAGDLHDYRFLDPRGAIVALSAKGKAKRDQSGFVL